MHEMMSTLAAMFLKLLDFPSPMTYGRMEFPIERITFFLGCLGNGVGGVVIHSRLKVNIFNGNRNWTMNQAITLNQ